jgi:hypothetical protein
MKTAELNDLLYYKGQLVRVTGIAIGKMVIMEPILDANDPSKKYNPGLCYPKIYVLEHSRNFQEGAEPISTVKTNPNHEPQKD